jgi:hypothetical protein
MGNKTQTRYLLNPGEGFSVAVVDASERVMLERLARAGDGAQLFRVRLRARKGHTLHEWRGASGLGWLDASDPAIKVLEAAEMAVATMRPECEK